MSDQIVGVPLLTAPLMAEVTIPLDAKLTDYIVPIPMGIFNDFILSSMTSLSGTQTFKVRVNYDASEQANNLRGSLITPPSQWSYNNVEGRFLYLTTHENEAGKTVTFQFRGR